MFSKRVRRKKYIPDEKPKVIVPAILPEPAKKFYRGLQFDPIKVKALKPLEINIESAIQEAQTVHDHYGPTQQTATIFAIQSYLKFALHLLQEIKQPDWVPNKDIVNNAKMELIRTRGGDPYLGCSKCEKVLRNCDCTAGTILLDKDRKLNYEIIEKPLAFKRELRPITFRRK